MVKNEHSMFQLQTFFNSDVFLLLFYDSLTFLKWCITYLDEKDSIASTCPMTVASDHRCMHFVDWASWILFSRQKNRDSRHLKILYSKIGYHLPTTSLQFDFTGWIGVYKNDIPFFFKFVSFASSRVHKSFREILWGIILPPNSLATPLHGFENFCGVYPKQKKSWGLLEKSLGTSALHAYIDAFVLKKNVCPLF